MVTWLSPMYYAHREGRLGIICFRGLPQNYHIVINVSIGTLLICLLFGSPKYTLSLYVYIQIYVYI